MNTLDVTIDTTHQILTERLHLAAAGTSSGASPREVQEYADLFLAGTCRHMCAATAVLAPAARQWLPDGTEGSRRFHRQCRRLDLALRQVKAKTYGSAYAVHRSWGEVWTDARTEFSATTALERRLVDSLVATIDPRAGDVLAARLHRMETGAPTRPHPYAPRSGTSGLVARLMWAWADRVWDGLEGRTPPAAVSRPPRPRGGPMTRYVLGNPAFDTEGS